MTTTITLSNSESPSSWAEVQALTTTWAQPADCAGIPAVQFPSKIPVENTPVDTHCEPPNHERVWARQGYYSPGVCPYKYTTSKTLGAGHTLDGEVIGPSQTAAICVPSGYTAWPHSLANITI